MKSIKTTKKRETREAGPPGVKIGHAYEVDSNVLYEYHGTRTHKAHINDLSSTIQAKMDEMEAMKKELNSSPWKKRMTAVITTKTDKTAKEIAEIHAQNLRKTSTTVRYHENYVTYQKDIDDCKVALDCLNLGDITEMKSLKNPPASVQHIG
jgi:hypothetical protein